MPQETVSPTAQIAWCGCLTPLGDAPATRRALSAGQVALQSQAALGEFGGEGVPLATFSKMQDDFPPRWEAPLDRFFEALPEGPWGSPTHPVIVTSSNFGVGHLLGLRKDQREGSRQLGTPQLAVDWIAQRYGLGEDRLILSHACVSAQLGLHLAAQRVQAPHVENVLVFTFDFLSPFVTGGFNSLKILNGRFPAPYREQETGSIGLGEGVAAAIVTADAGPWKIESSMAYNEMHHMTGNQPEGEGFGRILAPLAKTANGRRFWVKGHGTGTLEAGQLESRQIQEHWGNAPLVSWKGSLGHTLGSCGLVELAIALSAMEDGKIPGTVGTSSPTMTDSVATAPFPARDFDGFVLLSNAFGGAHTGCLITHA